VLRALRPDADDDEAAEDSGPDLAVQHDAAR